MRSSRFLDPLGLYLENVFPDVIGQPLACRRADPFRRLDF